MRSYIFGLYAASGFFGATADRMFTNVELQMPASMAAMSAPPQQSIVGSEELSVFLSVMSGQDVKVDQLDSSGALVDAFLSTAETPDPAALPPLPKLLVITTINEQDRQQLPPPSGGSVWRAVGAGNLDDILKAVHRMGTDVTPKLVDQQLVRDAAKAAEVNRLIEQAKLAQQQQQPLYAAHEAIETDEDKCGTMLAEEKNAVVQITGELNRWLASDQLAGLPLVVSLNPSRVTDCMRHDSRGLPEVTAAASELLRIVVALESAAVDAADGDALIAQVFYEPRSVQKAAEEGARIANVTWWNARAPAAFAVGGQGVIGEQDLSMLGAAMASAERPAIQIAARRRRLQGEELLPEETPTNNFPIPYSIWLWLWVAVIGFLIGGLLPLWWLTDLEDPVIDTKLFAAGAH